MHTVVRLASVLAVSATTVFAVASPSHATLIGDSVTCSDDSFGDCSPASAIVGAPQEFLQYGGSLGIDVQGFDIVLTKLSPAVTLILSNAGVLTVGDLDFQGEALSIVGFTLVSTDGVTNLTQSDLSFGVDSVSVNLQGTTFTGDSAATLRIATRPTMTNEVQEPATLALLGLSLAGFGLRRYRTQ